MRCFIALEISEELREELARLKLELSSCRSLRFVDPQNIHLTLKFLGEVQEAKLDKLKRALEAIPFSTVKLATTKLGTFPGILWLGMKLDSDLAQLQKEIQNAVSPFAMKDPRSYKPHLTIARFQDLSPQEQALLNEKITAKRIEARWKATHFILFQSTLTPHGPVYKELTRFPSK